MNGHEPTYHAGSERLVQFEDDLDIWDRVEMKVDAILMLTPGAAERYEANLELLARWEEELAEQEE